MRRLLTPLAALGLLVCLGGCVQVDERIALEPDGTGIYDLDLDWDAALARRLVDLVGTETAARLVGRALPWTEAAWRESLTGLAGVDVQTVALERRPGGRHHLRIRLAFDRIESLLAWELFARRTTRIREADPTTDAASAVAWTEDPLARVPVLDALARALTARRHPPAPEGARFPLLDPEPLQRLGLSRVQAGEAARLLEPALPKVVLTFRLRAPRAVASATMAATGARIEGREARFPWTFRDLGRFEERRLRLTWVPRPADVVPAIDHPGDGAGDSR